MKTPYDTIEYRGCKICIHQDESPSNPFEDWDCGPPLLTCYGGRHGYLRSYNDAPETWREIMHLLPADTWERGKRVDFYNQILSDKFGKKELVGEIRRYGCTFDAIADLLESEYGDKPSGWGTACEWFEVAESILNWGGIVAVCEQSTGYSQGDVTLCLAIATPEWVEKVGAPADSLKAQMEGAIELYGQWAWGDVYGFTCEDETGEELGEIGDSVWGFYGSDHEKSGLLEGAREAIDSHLAKQEKESQNLQLAFSFE